MIIYLPLENYMLQVTFSCILIWRVYTLYCILYCVECVCMHACNYYNDKNSVRGTSARTHTHTQRLFNLSLQFKRKVAY
jgi:hypothetical protein